MLTTVRYVDDVTAFHRIATHYFLSSTSDTLDGFTTQKCFQLMFRMLAALQELQSSTKS